MSKRRGKNAVHLVMVPDSFKPQRPWTVPEEFLAGRLYAKNLSLVDALGFCRTFNKRQLERGLADRRWAIIIRRAQGDWDGAETPAAAIAGGMAGTSTDLDILLDDDALGVAGGKGGEA